MNNKYFNPIPKDLDNQFGKSGFNYGLWFNKYIPINEPFDRRDDSTIKKEFHERQIKEYWEKISNNDQIKLLLDAKQKNFDDVCIAFSSQYKCMKITAELVSPMIVGIGESHYTEVGMKFDHNLGLPYIPSSTIKGISRLLFLLSELEEKNTEFEKLNKIDDSEFEYNAACYGTQKVKGNIIFLDAYPSDIPNIRLDIMNPHYPKYYQKVQKIPKENDNPVPIVFKVVEKGAKFVFRVLVNKQKLRQKFNDADLENLLNKICSTLQKVLEEGIGAKNSLGYGRFSTDVKKLPQKQEAIKNIKYKLEQEHILTVIQVTENNIRVKNPKDGLEQVIGKKHAKRDQDKKSLYEIYKQGEATRCKVIGFDKKNNPRFKVLFFD